LPNTGRFFTGLNASFFVLSAGTAGFGVDTLVTLSTEVNKITLVVFVTAIVGYGVFRLTNSSVSLLKSSGSCCIPDGFSSTHFRVTTSNCVVGVDGVAISNIFTLILLIFSEIAT